MPQIKLSFKRRTIPLDVKESSFLGKLTGLMFKPSNTSPLLFSFSRKKRISLHSMFVFFDFLILWLDENNNVIDYKLAKPFEIHISSPKKCSKILEIPINPTNKRAIEFFVGKQKDLNMS